MKFIRALRNSTAVFGNKTFLFFLTNKRLTGFAKTKKREEIILVGTSKADIPKSKITILFDCLLVEVNRLLECSKWLPGEICQISFYYEKLHFFSNQFQNYRIMHEDHEYELIDYLALSLLVSEILSSKYVTDFDPPDLITCVGDRLAFEVSGIYEAFMQHSKDFASQFYFDKKKIQEKSDGKFYQCTSRSAKKSKVEIIFDFLFKEVERLLTYPDWLPIERCQISYYYEKLVYFSKELERSIITDAIQEYQLIDKIPPSLLASEILSSKYVISFDHPDLTHFGDRIAFEVSQIYKAFMQDSPDLDSQFHFNKKKFQEFEEEVFVGFQAEAGNLLKQLACITKKRLKVISIVGMAGLGKTTLASRLYNDPYVVSYFYVRAWVTCSQVHHKKDLLLSILKSVIDISDEVFFFG